MEKEFVPYPLALRLKALGFDEPCFAWYGSDYTPQISGSYKNSTHTFNYCVSAPILSQAFRWFREECGIWVTFEYDDCDCVEADICWYVGKCFRYGIGPLFLTNELGDFKTSQEAELACLEKLLEIIESKSE